MNARQAEVTYAARRLLALIAPETNSGLDIDGHFIEDVQVALDTLIKEIEYISTRSDTGER